MIRLSLCAVVVMLGVAPVLAHAIRATVSVTETQVVVKVSFDGDDDIRGDVFVRLEDEQHKELGKLKLSGSNVATFDRPTAEGVYFVVAEDDGFGHRVEKRLTVVAQRTYQEVVPEPSVNIIKVAQGLAGILFASVLVFFLLRRSGKAKHGP